jgi:ABC-type Mn2+/Zn2+ transport system permease subunit
VLTDPWTEGIVRRAFAEVVLLGIVGGVLGCWIVFHELSYSAESLSHALFPGLVIAALSGASLILGAAGGLLVASVAIALAGRSGEIGSDSSVAIVVSGLFGLGALLALSAESPPRLNALLFGDILGVSNLDLALAAGLAVVSVAVLAALHRQLMLVGFDRTNARALGGRPLLVDATLLVLLALAVLVGVQGLGSLLVVTILVGPAATARLVARRMGPMMALATLLGILTGAGGLYLSYYADTGGGASIAAAVVALYVVLWALTAAASGRGRARAIAVANHAKR